MFRKIANYVGVDILCKLITVISIPVFALYMSPYELGVYGQWFAVYNLVSIIVGMAISTYFVIVLTKYSIVSPSSELAAAINAVIISFLFFLGVALIMLGDVNYALAVLAALFSNVFQVNMSLFRVKNDIKGYAGNNFFYSFLGVILPFVAVYLYQTAEARIYSFTISMFIVSLGAFSWLYNYIKNEYDSWQSCYPGKRFLSYGLPITFIGIASWARGGADIYLIAKFMNDQSSGFYFISFQFASILLILSASINRAVMPEISSFLNSNDLNKFYKMSFLLCGCYLVVSVIISIGAHIYIKLYLPEYLLSLNYLIPIIVGAFFYVTANTFANLLVHSELTKLISFSVVASSIFHVVFSLILCYTNRPDLIIVLSIYSSLLYLLIIIYFVIDNSRDVVKGRCN